MAPSASFSVKFFIFELHGRIVHFIHHVLTDRCLVLSMLALADIFDHFAILFSLVQCHYRRYVLTQCVPGIPGKPGNMLIAIGALSC